jgi:hypothetical protein
MSNEDEDEVEDELERMESEANAINLPKAPLHPLAHEIVEGVEGGGVARQPLPNVPPSINPDNPERLQKQKERANARKVALHA